MSDSTTQPEVNDALEDFSNAALALAVAYENMASTAETLAVAFQRSTAEVERAAARTVYELCDATAEAPAPESEPEPERSYLSGVVLTGGMPAIRHAACRSARYYGYDLEHWSGRVRAFRTALNVTRETVATMVGMSPSAITAWEAGTSFARMENVKRLESVAAGMLGWSHASWKNGQDLVPEEVSDGQA